MRTTGRCPAPNHVWLRLRLPTELESARNPDPAFCLTVHESAALGSRCSPNSHACAPRPRTPHLVTSGLPRESTLRPSLKLMFLRCSIFPLLPPLTGSHWPLSRPAARSPGRTSDGGRATHGRGDSTRAWCPPTAAFQVLFYRGPGGPTFPSRLPHRGVETGGRQGPSCCRQRPLGATERVTEGNPQVARRITPVRWVPSSPSAPEADAPGHAALGASPLRGPERPLSLIRTPSGRALAEHVP